MAFPAPHTEYKEEKIVGLKLDISPDILPRDTSIGTKVFVLVPNEAKYVREVKSYLANFVLKTPTPFHLYMGDYRIREEEDALIFSIINEPCRLLPVPLPRSALSSTPKPKSTENSVSSKRVTFFDGDLSASPVYRPSVNGVDVIDQSHPGRSIPSPHQLVPPKLDNDAVIQNEMEVDLDDSSAERKKRRRRRHRSKKSKSKSSLIDSGNEDEELKETESRSSKKASCDESQSRGDAGSGAVDKNPLEVLNEETESEDETTGESSVKKDLDFEFATPSLSFISRKRCDSDSSIQQGGKKKKLSDSAFLSSASLLSPPCSDDLRLSSGKPRQDTPNLPRVVRNPRLFENAKKIIDVFSESPTPQAECSRNGGRNGSGSLLEESEQQSEVAEQPTIKDESDYFKLPAIISQGELKVGDVVAFKVLQLDERYNPSVSQYKEGKVNEICGTRLNILYTKNDAVNQTGKFEIDLGNEDLSGGDDIIKQGEAVDLAFSELIDPKFISKTPVGDLGCANESSPPSVI